MASDAYWKPRPRMATTGEKARNILGLVYVEDLEKAGHTYGDLLAYLDGMACGIGRQHRHTIPMVSACSKVMGRVSMTA